MSFELCVLPFHSGHLSRSQSLLELHIWGNIWTFSWTLQNMPLFFLWVLLGCQNRLETSTFLWFLWILNIMTELFKMWVFLYQNVFVSCVFMFTWIMFYTSRRNTIEYDWITPTDANTERMKPDGVKGKHTIRMFWPTLSHLLYFFHEYIYQLN